jgi:hypothetical protein
MWWRYWYDSSNSFYAIRRITKRLKRLKIKIEFLKILILFLKMTTETETVKCCWVSIDPIRRKIDFYPGPIAKRIEQSYQERDPWTQTACVLGSDFFNATVLFHPSGTCYQTTPGMSMGRAGFKQPGYRSVKRLFVNQHKYISLYSKQIHGEWRLSQNEHDYGTDLSVVELRETIPTECLITCETITESNQELKPWTSADLESRAWDVSVIVWQWCRGTLENNGNLLNLSEDWWTPYNTNINSSIESVFKEQTEEHAGELKVDLPIIGERFIKFKYDTCYASQITLDRTKSRLVRRVVKTIQEVKEMFDKISTPPFDMSALIAALPDGTIPHHFYCPILQDIMKDPVKTIDNFTYDREAIHRWFEDHNTSPLTGLSLTNKNLIPNTTLKIQIDEFIATLK